MLATMRQVQKRFFPCYSVVCQTQREDGRALAPVHFCKAVTLPPLPLSSLLGLSFDFCPGDLSSAGITNSEFHAGRAEKILPQLLKSKEDGHFIVAVVNPARAGLRKNG